MSIVPLIVTYLQLELWRHLNDSHVGNDFRQFCKTLPEIAKVVGLDQEIVTPSLSDGNPIREN